jgi:hypothetical protein
LLSVSHIEFLVPHTSHPVPFKYAKIRKSFSSIPPVLVEFVYFVNILQHIPNDRYIRSSP